MNKRTERQINNIYNQVFKKVFNRTRITKGSQGKKQEIIAAILKLENSKQYNKFAKKFAKKLAQSGLSQQKGIWKKHYQAAKAKHIVGIPSTYKAYELQLFEKAVEHNFEMIKSIPQHTLEVYKMKAIQSVINQIAKGNAGRKSFENVLKQHGAKNAKLIARTESAKLQTTIDEYRATSLGSVCYEWLSSNDRRTRQSHKDMNGVVVFWRKDSEKPLLDNMRGNAGEFPNCRCTTIPILDEDDLKKSSYKVYDYKNDKIITLSKQKLIEKIKEGKL